MAECTKIRKRGRRIRGRPGATTTKDLIHWQLSHDEKRAGGLQDEHMPARSGNEIREKKPEKKKPGVSHRSYGTNTTSGSSLRHRADVMRRQVHAEAHGSVRYREIHVKIKSTCVVVCGVSGTMASMGWISETGWISQATLVLSTVERGLEGRGLAMLKRRG